MTTDPDRFKALYGVQVRPQNPASRRNCPSPKRMVRLLTSRCSTREGAKLIDHISLCSDCAGEFAFLTEAIRSERVLVGDIENWLGTGQKAEPRRPHLLRYSWGLAPLLAAFFIVGFLVLKLVVLRSPERYRAAAEARVALLEPVEQKVSRQSLVFRWQPVPGVEHYVVEVFDEALSPVWKSPPLLETRIVPPDPVARGLVPRKSYFWLVSAYFSGGDKWLSPLEEFTPKD
jgi:hypothetical protein